MTMTSAEPTITSPLRAVAAATPTLRPLVDLTDHEQVGAWAVDPTASLHELADAVREWPSWRWVGVAAAAVTDVFPPAHPGRPIVFGLPVTAGEDDAITARRIGSWANIAVTGLGADTATDAAALDRLRPEVGVIDGHRLGRLTPRALSGALSGLAALLGHYDVLPVLDTSRAPHLLVDAAVDAGIRIAC